LSLKFGTSGLRGLSVDLQGSPSFLYASAFAIFLLRNGLAKPGAEVLVAGDFRESSPAIAANVRLAIQTQGLVPIDCGEVPTPALAFFGRQNGVASLMITGSHIPADRNGIKFYLPQGEIDKADEQEISRIAAELLDSKVPVRSSGVCQNRAAEVAAAFLHRNKAVLTDGALSGMRIGNYQHSTVARDMLSQILRHYGAEVVELGRSESFIPVDTEAVSDETLKLLQAWAKENALDAIVSTDGDGDRPLVADEKGQPVNGDICGLITAQFLKADAVVTPVTSNSGIDGLGFASVVRTRVGSPYVIAGMQDACETYARVVGFEANGGTLTASLFDVENGKLDPLPTRDSFLPILAVLVTAHRAGVPLSSVRSNQGLPVTAADRLENYAADRSATLMRQLLSGRDQLQHLLKSFGDVAQSDETDGLRVTLRDRRVIHFRPSGNAPEMRCYVEASDEERAKQTLKDGLIFLQAF
jgi:phosphomannomutase